MKTGGISAIFITRTRLQNKTLFKLMCPERMTLSTIFSLEFGTVWAHQTILTPQLFIEVPGKWTVLFFCGRDMIFLLYFGTVPTVWYCMLFILLIEITISDRIYCSFTDVPSRLLVQIVFILRTRSTHIQMYVLFKVGTTDALKKIQSKISFKCLISKFY